MHFAKEGARHNGGVVLVLDASNSVDAVGHYFDVGGIQIPSLCARRWICK